MARNLKAKIKIEADTKQATKGLKDVGKSVDSLGQKFVKFGVGLLGVVAALRVITGAVTSSIRAFIVQEDAVNKLDAALASLGAEGKVVSKNLQDLASEMQKVTKFGDELTISALAQLAAFTKNEEEIQVLIKASADLAQGQGISLASAASLVGRSFATSTNALTRQGVELDAVAGSTERLFQISEEIAKLYGGQALAATLTLSGAFERLQNAVGDSAENFGEAFVEATKLERSMRVLAIVIENLNSAEEKQVGFLGRFIQKMIEMDPVIGIVANSFKLWEQVLVKIEARFGVSVASLDVLKKELEENAEAANKAAKETKALEKAQEAAAKAAKALTDEEESVTDQLEALGVVIESTVRKEILRLNLLLEAARDRFLSTGRGAAQLEATEILVARAIEELNRSLETQGGVLADTSEATDQYSFTLQRATGNLDLLTDAELRNVAIVEDATRRRATARFVEAQSFASTGFGGRVFGQSSLTGERGLGSPFDISGGTFTILTSPTTRPSGRVDP